MKHHKKHVHGDYKTRRGAAAFLWKNRRLVYTRRINGYVRHYYRARLVIQHLAAN